MKILVSQEIKDACPQFAGMAIAATVKNTPYSEALWQKIDEFTLRYREMYTTDSIKDMVTIKATRDAYKKCGKDPSRYRPSGEALCRARHCVVASCVAFPFIKSIRWSI